jgi:hypothetical protein
MLRNASGRYDLNYPNPEDYIPAIDEQGRTRVFERDRQALVFEGQDHSGIVERFNKESRTLILSSSHDIGADDLNVHVKAAIARDGRVDRLVLYIPQDCWAEDLHFFLRNHFERDVTLEQGTSRIALVRDLTITPTTVKESHASKPEPPKTLTAAEIERESQELDRQIAALSKTRGANTAYLRDFEQ